MSSRPNLFFALFVRAFLCLGIGLAAQPAVAQPSIDGRYIAQRNCAQCHAIGRTGESRLKAAPPFRDLSNVGDMEDLVAALRAGLLTHHPAMPELRLTPAEISSLAAYLREVQTKQSVRLEGIPQL
jgi:cytochrome c